MYKTKVKCKDYFLQFWHTADFRWPQKKEVESVRPWRPFSWTSTVWKSLILFLKISHSNRKEWLGTLLLKPYFMLFRQRNVIWTPEKIVTQRGRFPLSALLPNNMAHWICHQIPHPPHISWISLSLAFSHPVWTVSVDTTIRLHHCKIPIISHCYGNHLQYSNIPSV